MPKQKRLTFLILTLGIILFTISVLSREIGYCPSYSYSSCVVVFNALAEMLLLVFPALFLFFVVYFMRNEIYEAWFLFTRWWIPLSMLSVLVAPEYAHDWMYPIEKGNVAFGMSIIFILVSVLIIIVKFLSLKKGR